MYFFSAIYEFKATIDGRVTEAEVQTKESAKQTYDEAVKNDETAFLIEGCLKSLRLYCIKLVDVFCREYPLMKVSFLQKKKRNDIVWNTFNFIFLVFFPFSMPPPLPVTNLWRVYDPGNLMKLLIPLSLKQNRTIAATSSSARSAISHRKQRRSCLSPTSSTCRHPPAKASTMNLSSSLCLPCWTRDIVPREQNPISTSSTTSPIKAANTSSTFNSISTPCSPWKPSARLETKWRWETTKPCRRIDSYVFLPTKPIMRFRSTTTYTLFTPIK